MSQKQKYTVVVPFPTGGGHWAAEGAELELLDVQAHALVTAGRLRLTSEVKAEAEAVEAAAAAPVGTSSTSKKTTVKAE
ncbi:hypothetical protein G7007_18770 [Pseudomonas entomophila]|nr:hypothetical protein [Pseudomonas entomophila]MBA1194872.1 hypothetical protein [Pseudomonas entomophila]